MGESTRYPDGHEVSPGDWADQSVLELPERSVMSLIDPTLADSTLSYANAVQNTPIDQNTAASNPMIAQGATTATTTAQNVHAAENTATAENIQSAGSTASANQEQYAPSTITS